MRTEENAAGKCGSDAFDAFSIKRKRGVLKTYKPRRSLKWNRAVDTVISVSS